MAVLLSTWYFRAESDRVDQVTAVVQGASDAKQLLASRDEQLEINKRAIEGCKATELI